MTPNQPSLPSLQTEVAVLGSMAQRQPAHLGWLRYHQLRAALHAPDLRHEPVSTRSCTLGYSAFPHKAISLPNLKQPKMCGSESGPWPAGRAGSPTDVAKGCQSWEGTKPTDCTVSWKWRQGTACMRTASNKYLAYD